ncbi:MAG: tetratricopeptide repeat protein [bacterium]
MRSLALLLLLAAPGWAQPIDRPQAQALFQKGAEAFRAEHFEEALRYFEAARTLDPAPVLTYNIARAHEEMGQAQAAIDAYRAYLQAAPDAEDRADVERRIRVMRAIVDRQPAESAVVVAPPAAEPVAPPVAQAGGAVDAGRPWQRPVAYGLAGLGVAVIGVGAWLGVQADDDAAAHRRATTGAARETTADDAESAALQANISFGVGAALVAGGVVLWLLDDGPGATALVPTVDGVGIRGTF